jgi:predicted amidophosphoribosyltransferase
MSSRDRCPVCGSVAGAPCAACVAGMRPAPGGLEPPPGLAALHAALRYEGVGRELVARLKYRDARAAVGWVADAMVRRLGPPPPAAVVTWAPTSAGRARQRGFDQAELLARAVARRLRRPARPLLRRTGELAQTGRSRAERLASVAFVARRSASGPVVVVDDVVTTGATLSAAAGALLAVGATPVVGLVAAVTPPPTERAPGPAGDDHPTSVPNDPAWSTGWAPSVPFRRGPSAVPAVERRS